MKAILTATFCFLLFVAAMAEIRNGYNPEYVAARYAIDYFEIQLTRTDLSDTERRKIHAAMKLHHDVIFRYQLTEVLLKQMAAISPDMFGAMNELRDKRGRITDVYVRFIQQESSVTLLSGASFFRDSELDEDASFSRFGELTVAIDVWICDAALNLLAHEFGHTCYIVPNLAVYRSYYRKVYQATGEASLLGHSTNDLSGKMAYDFGRQFLSDRRDFRIRFGKRPTSVATYIGRTRNSVKHDFQERTIWPVASVRQVQ